MRLVYTETTTLGFHIARHILESNGIAYFLKNMEQHSQADRPPELWVVRDDDEEDARRLLEGLKT